MENNKPKNQPAFPLASSGLQSAQSGMTLRDYFAAKAMQAICSAEFTMDHISLISRSAYKIADAMLIERQSK